MASRVTAVDVIGGGGAGEDEVNDVIGGDADAGTSVPADADIETSDVDNDGT